jgi:hypothetical protein
MLVILYADDTVLFADSAVEMQIQLDNFSEYCSLWKLNVNSSKTKVVIFAGGRFPTNNFNFNFDGNNLEIVSDIVYLGVNFSRNLRWTRSIVSKFEKPQISQPYNRIGLTILSKRSY